MRGGGGRHRPQHLRLKRRRCPAAQPRTCAASPGNGEPMTQPTELDLPDLRAALAGAYGIEAPIGRGGMSYVCLARERRLDRRVAIKVLLPDLARDDARRGRFLREARTVARLTHPGIVPIFTVDEVGGVGFFSMAVVAGVTLRERAATRGTADAQWV